MNRLTRWLDGVIERFCHWMNDALSDRHRLTLLGEGLAGVGGGVLLPVDRRIDPTVVEMHINWNEKANGASAKSGSSSSPTSCGFWAYCHMSGQPCTWCDGKNALLPGNPYAAQDGDFSNAGKDLCPSGYHNGAAWYGCCKDPSGNGKLIAFMDCCTASTLIRPFNTCSLWRLCHNWPEAKNWCVTNRVLGVVSLPGNPVVNVIDTEHYYCTAVIDMQKDQSCN